MGRAASVELWERASIKRQGGGMGQELARDVDPGEDG